MLGIDGIYPSRVEKISLSFAALTRSISFSTLEINFFFQSRIHALILANQIASFAVRFFTNGPLNRTAADFKLKVNKKIILSTV